MNNPSTYMPAEWQHECAVLIAWPHKDTDWLPILPQVTRCYTNIIENFTTEKIPVIIVAPDKAEVIRSIGDNYDHMLVRIFGCPTNDTWTRDYGPITIVQRNSIAIIDFKFNAWGLKFAADKDNLVTSRLCNAGIITAKRINRLGFVLEGGSIESDGNGTLLTTAQCLTSPNRNGDLTRQEIEQRLKLWLGAERILWLEHGALQGDDTDSHIDTLARLAPNDTIIYSTASPTDDHYHELKLMKDEILSFRTAHGSPYNLAELPIPDPIFDTDGNRLPATYCNYLATPHAIFMPTYSQPVNDKTAAEILKTVFGVKVVGIECTPLIMQHGSLHCATMQIPLQAIRL